MKLWRVSDGVLLATLAGHTSWVYNVVFSPNSWLIATGSEDGTIRLWGIVR